MRNAQFALTAIALASIPISTEYSKAQVGEVVAIAGTVAVDSVVKNLHAAITDIIDKLDNSIGSATFLARSNMQVLLGDVDYQGSQLAGKTFGELNKTQQDFFNNAQLTVKQLNGTAEEITSKVDTVLQRSEFLIGMIPFTDKEPRLRRHFPNVAIYDKEKFDTGVNVRFDGSWLASGTPSLKMGNKDCTLQDEKEVSLLFKCKLETFSNQSYNEGITGSLELPFPKTLFDKIRMWFGSNGNSKKYPVSIEIIPQKMADIAVVANQENYSKKENSRSAAFDTGAKHCVSGVSTTINISRAGPEWEIDVNTIRVNVTSSNGGQHNINSLTNVGFQLIASAQNHGDCGPFWKDARGWHSGVVSWTETTKVTTVAPVKVYESPLNWQEKKIISLPENTKSFIVTMRRFDGIVRQYNSNDNDTFVSIRSTPTNSSVAVEASDAEKVFR